MDGSESEAFLNAVGFVKRTVLKNNEQYRLLEKKFISAQLEIKRLKAYNADLLEELRSLGVERSDSPPAVENSADDDNSQVFNNSNDEDDEPSSINIITVTMGECKSPRSSNVREERAFESRDVESTPVEAVMQESFRRRKTCEGPPKVYTCQYCGKTLKQRATWIVHERIHRGEKPFKCPRCDYRGVAKYYLLKHVRKHVADLKSAHDLLAESLAVEATSADGGVMDQERPINAERAPPNKNGQTEQGRPHTCQFCQKAFHQRGHLNVHERIHTGEKPFKCPQCDYCSNTKANVIAHIKRTHDNPREKREPMIHACQYCGKTFRMRGHCKNHERVHTGEKPYTCEQCDYCGTTNSNLVAHIKRTHDNPREKRKRKVHACQYCGKTFRIRGHCQSHERIHTGEKPYSCQQCDYRSTTKSNVVAHTMRIHRGKARCRKSEAQDESPSESAEVAPAEEDDLESASEQQQTSKRDRPTMDRKTRQAKRVFTCQYCQKTFNLKFHWEAHEREHTNDDQFECRHCDHTSATKTDLETHIEDVHGRFCCAECDEDFSRKSLLTNHADLVHNSDQILG